jgi:hypothetical protein
METGIRAELSFPAADSCRVAELSAAAGVEVDSISRSVAPETGRVTEEFSTQDGSATVRGAEQVFSYGEKSIYRFERDYGRDCPCETVEEFGSPVQDVHTTDGTLHLAVHVEDMIELQSVVGEVRERYPDLSVDRLVRSQPDGDSADLVLVNRGELTPRQREVLETAHRLGYFRHPKGANAGEVADHLDITTSTFTEHLSAAQSKLLSAILEE